MIDHLYFIAICPNDRLKEKIHQQKEWIYQKYGVKGAFRSSAHITLQMPFKMGIKKRVELLEDLHVFAESIKTFRVQLNGFDCFEPRVVFIKVFENEQLNLLQNELIPVLKQHQIFNSTHNNRGFHPHITVAFRDLKKRDFYPLWNDVKNISFDESFLAEGLTLYQHNGKGWDEEEFIPFKD
jgi:2'-5' RNA ligase